MRFKINNRYIWTTRISKDEAKDLLEGTIFFCWDSSDGDFCICIKGEGRDQYKDLLRRNLRRDEDGRIVKLDFDPARDVADAKHAYTNVFAYMQTYFDLYRPI